MRIDGYMESIRVISLSQLAASMSACINKACRGSCVTASACTSTLTRTIEIEAWRRTRVWEYFVLSGSEWNSLHVQRPRLGKEAIQAQNSFVSTLSPL